MITAHFQSKTLILLIVFLNFCLLQVQNYELHKFKGWHGNAFKFICVKNESLHNSTPVKNYKNNLNETITATELNFHYCPPPKKPYLETLKEININASQVTRIMFYEMADSHLLMESLFEGMPLMYLSIDSYHISINRTGKLDLSKGSSYKLECDEDKKSLINKKTLFPNRSLNVPIVSFIGCVHPNVSYLYFLSKLKVNPFTIKDLSFIRSNLSLNDDHFKGLSLHYDKLSVYYETTRKLNPDIFEEISVDELYLNGVELKKLQKFRVNKATLEGGKFLGEWGDCSTLKSLTLNSFNVSNIPGGWISNCNHLTELTVIEDSQEGVEKMLMGAHNLLNLIIINCKIRELRKHFAKDAMKLKKLIINMYPDYKIHIQKDAFDALKNLEELDISHAGLSGFKIFQAIMPLKNLRNLTMNRTPLVNFCSDFDDYFKTAIDTEIIRGIEKVSFQESSLSKICFTEWQNLTYLDLSYSQISYLNIHHLPVPHKRPLTVDLTGNPLKTVPEFSSIYPVMIKKFNASQNITILLHHMTVECDCEHSWFMKTLRDLPQISLQNVKCSSRENIVNFTGEKSWCKKYICGDCLCRISLDDYAAIADCKSKNLFKLPDVWDFKIIDNNDVIKKIVVKKLLVSSNLIRLLPALYPTSLVEVDLRNNKISHLTDSVISALFSDNRTVHLSKNPFVCDCETKAMIDALSMRHHQIPDYKKLHCMNLNSYLHEISNHLLCLERPLLIFGILSVSLLALAAVMTSLYFRNKLTVKAFLYARGLCLYCVTEEELDADKEYDAFISFSGLDYELVEEELLPGLENDYKLCVHTRDWIPGEMIYTQIFESVEKSRRTVIVLTKNFVESVWGIVEFRTAYIKALREGRVRVICILVDDDINDMDLAPDLKAYLKSNTYLEWKDPWFWQKLRYALPHPSVTNQSVLRNENEENRCQEIELASI